MSKLVFKVLILFLFFQTGNCADISEWKHVYSIGITHGFDAYYELMVPIPPPWKRKYFGRYWEIPRDSSIQKLSKRDVEVLKGLENVFLPEYYSDEIPNHIVKWSTYEGDSLIGGTYRLGEYKFILKETPEGYLRIFVIAKPIECKYEIEDIIKEIFQERRVGKDDFLEPESYFFTWTHSKKGGFEIFVYNMYLGYYSRFLKEGELPDPDRKSEHISFIEVSIPILKLRDYK
ncbi:MAG: hypothetical protein GY855_03410 [candidate division Zixibacteria bacterium]|nr:hypothetical protein [candidate division Zixibacteria bacterium]